MLYANFCEKAIEYNKDLNLVFIDQGKAFDRVNTVKLWKVLEEYDVKAKCLYDRAKRLVTKPSVISEEKKHLSSVLVSNGYPSSFVQKISKARTAPRKEPVAQFKSTAVLPYVQGESEPLRHCLEQQGICAVFKSETTIRLYLVRHKDTVDPTKQDGVVYRIPCECRKVYIGETGRSMHERIKEHDRDIRLARTQTPAVSEHAQRDRPLSALERGKVY